MTAPLLEIENVVRDFRLPRRTLFGPRPVLRALDGVSLKIASGESLGIVGESGSGKSTLARLVTGLDRPDSGEIRFRGEPVHGIARKGPLPVQMVFQDPFGSLDPRQTVARIVAEPLIRLNLDAAERERRISRALEEVGLGMADAARRPHEFSGGQRQRIAIARALITGPALLCADEPVSALDVSVQAQVLNLFADLKERLGLACLFISHDLAVVAHVTDRVAIMKDGRICETGPTMEVLRRPAHPYTQALLGAVLPPDPAQAKARLAALSPGPARPPRA